MSDFFWHKFVPKDWKSDPALSRCSATTRGVWIDAIATMMQLGTDRLTGTDSELARDCRCTEKEISATHEQISSTNTATTSEQKGCKTWICRRLQKELQIKGLRSKAALSKFSKPDANTMQNLLPIYSANMGAKRQQRSNSNSNSNSIKGVFDKWNDIKGVSFCLLISDRRRMVLAARLQEPFFTEHWEEAMQKVGASDFLKGKNDRGWKANFDWFTRPDVVVKIMEGKYDNAAKNGVRQSFQKPVIPTEVSVCEYARQKGDTKGFAVGWYRRWGRCNFQRNGYNIDWKVEFSKDFANQRDS